MMKDGLAGFVRRPYQPAEVVGQIRSILAAARSSEGGPGISPLIPMQAPVRWVGLIHSAELICELPFAL